MLARILQDHVGRLLGDHNDGGVGIARYQIRHDGGIDDAQALDPAKAKPLIHHRERIVAHPAGRGRMIDRAAALPAKSQQILIAHNLRTRLGLLDHEGLERRRGQNLAQDLQALDIDGAIGFGREVIDADFRRRHRVGALDAKRAAALRPHLAHRRAESGIGMQLLAHLVGRERQEVNLDVGRRQPRIGLEERARGARGDGQRSLAERRIARAGHDTATRMIEDVVERDRLRATHHDPDLHVILQVVADAGGVEHDVNAVALQQLRRSDAGELQQLRRVIRAARDQDFLARPHGAQSPVLPVFDPVGTPPVEQDPLRQRRGLDVQVAASLGGTQIRPRRARPPAVPRRGLKPAGAFLRRAVEVGIVGYAGLDRRLDECPRQRIGVQHIRHRQRTAGAVIIIGAALLVFGLLEIRQYVVKTPAGVAVLAPAVVILVLAANVQQAVDRTRSAQHFAARLKYLAAVQPRFGLGLVHPVDGLFLEQLAVAERHMDPQIAVLGTGFEQQHRMLAVGAEAIGEHASGGAGADDDVVEFGSSGRCAACRARGFFSRHAVR